MAENQDNTSVAVNALGGYGRGLYAEKWAPFVKELSVIVARGRDNTILCYPVVETIQSQDESYGCDFIIYFCIFFTCFEFYQKQYLCIIFTFAFFLELCSNYIC